MRRNIYRLEGSVRSTTKPLLSKSLGPASSVSLRPHQQVVGQTRGLVNLSRPYICQQCLRNGSRRLQSTAPASQQDHHETPPPSSKAKSAYDLFPSTLSAGPPPSGPFEIDLASLRREFLQLQAKAHPDRHADPTMKHRAEATSAAFNDAYRTLTDPLQRARHILLIRQGIDLEADEASKEEDQELLMSVLEAREVIEEAEEESQLEGLQEENEERIQSSQQALSTAFANGDWSRAKREAIRLRYWTNIRDSIRAWEKGKPVILVH